MIIIIPGKPIAKKRPQFARRGKYVQTYNSQQTEEGKFFLQAKMQWKGEPLTGPVSIRMTFFVQRPKSHFGTGKNSGKLKPSAPEFPEKKPDLDNYEKFASDCLNGICWKDDSQIVDSMTRKRYTATNPRTEIEIKTIWV